MTETTHHNGQIPTDPATLLALLLAITYAAGQLAPEQAAALEATGGITDLALLLLHLTRGNR